MADLPEIGTMWQPREDSIPPRLIRRPGVVVGTLDQPSVTLQHTDGSQSTVALSVLRRDLERAPDLSDVPDELLQLELLRRTGESVGRLVRSMDAAKAGAWTYDVRGADEAATNDAPRLPDRAQAIVDTLRWIASDWPWIDQEHRSMMVEVAAALERRGVDTGICDCCEETWCDRGCPMAPLRDAAQESPDG